MLQVSLRRLAEHDGRINHQLRIVRVGLLATWETPAELICAPRVVVAERTAG
jgi:hypothetical protein